MVLKPLSGYEAVWKFQSLTLDSKQLFAVSILLSAVSCAHTNAHLMPCAGRVFKVNLNIQHSTPVDTMSVRDTSSEFVTPSRPKPWPPTPTKSH